MNVVAAGRSRCLAVAAGLTAALWGAAAVLVRSLAAGQPATLDEALVRLCLAGLVAAAAWAWLQVMAGVADAWRGTTPTGRHSAVRRLSLLACGAVLAGALASPAADASSHGPRPDLLAGLPLPERAVGPAQRPAHRVVVRAGDSLWTLAAVELGSRATDREITERWHAVYRDNRALIGADPDLILPGQVLRLPHLAKEQP